MSVSVVVAAAALVTAVVALIVAFRTQRRLISTDAALAAANAALEKEREATAHSIGSVRQATVDEVATLLENFMAQVDTEVAAWIAEGLARLGDAGRSTLGPR